FPTPRLVRIPEGGFLNRRIRGARLAVGEVQLLGGLDEQRIDFGVALHAQRRFGSMDRCRIANLFQPLVRQVEKSPCDDALDQGFLQLPRVICLEPQQDQERHREIRRPGQSRATIDVLAGLAPVFDHHSLDCFPVQSLLEPQRRVIVRDKDRTHPANHTWGSGLRLRRILVDLQGVLLEIDWNSFLEDFTPEGGSFSTPNSVEKLLIYATRSNCPYYVCRDHSDAHRASAPDRCQARYAPAAALDELVWKDLRQLLTEPSLVTAALQRAQAGEWLPQALQAQRQNITRALKRLEKQQAQLLDLHLAEIIDRAEFERKRQELAQTHSGLTQQLKELEAQAQRQLDAAALAAGIEEFCQRLQPTLDQLSFAQRRQLVELLIDRVIVNNGKVEVRYVIPTGPAGEKVRFCHLRKDYFIQ